MPSILHQSSTADADSAYDRYSVDHGTHRSKDGEESRNNSVSFRPLSVASESSFDSGTYGTSCVSDGSETIEHDESYDDEFGDLDTLSLESQPMVMDRWVDSACSCLDHPVIAYQRMCLGRETSLLRQSKARSRPTIHQNVGTPTNLSLLAAKRRSLRQKGKEIRKAENIKKSESAIDDGKKNEIQIMRIQPEEDLEIKDAENTDKTKKTDRNTLKGQEREAIEKKQRETLPRPEHPTKNNHDLDNFREDQQMIEKKEIREETQSVSNPTKSMIERAIQKAAKEDEERDIHSHLSETLKEKDTKIDPPSDTQASVANREGQSAESCSANHEALELATCERSSEISSNMDEKATMEGSVDPSGRVERSPFPPAIDQNSDDEDYRSINDAPQTKKRDPESNDEISLSNSVEIIDVLSMDDQDSWTPGSGAEDEPTLNNNGDSHHQDHLISLQSNEHNSTLIPAPSMKNQDKQDEYSMTADSSNVDDIWIEEEAKLNMKTSFNGVTPPRPKVPSPAQSAEDLWNEERMKLQASSDDIFHDPKAREAFLGHRQGRLRDSELEKSSSSNSKSRRQKIQRAFKGIGREEASNSRHINELPRSMSTGRNRPSPETISMIEQSRSETREQSLASKAASSKKVGGDFLHVAPLPSRKNDLVAVRSIEEGQRIRTSRREADKYKSDSHKKSSVHASIDIHNYAGEPPSRGPYDEQSNPSRYNKLDRMIDKLSRQRSRSRDPKAETITTSDERDDQESLPTIRPTESGPMASNIEKKWSGYETAISATKELRKLERKIERQLRRTDLDVQRDQSKEIRRIEKKLSKKLRSIKSDGIDAHAMSSSEIRRLEEQLAQKLSAENENRASKLKRIKRKGVSSARGLVSPSNKLKEERQYLAQASSSNSGKKSRERTPEYTVTSSTDHDKSRFENSKSMRSRYTRRVIGRRSYTRVPETD